MKLGIDFKAIATKAGGHAAGAAAFTQLNKLEFMKKLSTPEKAGTKGLITAAIGYIGVPMIAKKMGLAGKGGKGAFVEAVGEGLGMVGVMIAANSFIKPTAGQPAMFPIISGVDDETGVFGYETNPIEGIGDMYGYNDNEEVSGYETDATLAGLEEDGHAE